MSRTELKQKNSTPVSADYLKECFPPGTKFKACGQKDILATDIQGLDEHVSALLMLPGDGLEQLGLLVLVQPNGTDYTVEGSKAPLYEVYSNLKELEGMVDSSIQLLPDKRNKDIVRENLNKGDVTEEQIGILQMSYIPPLELLGLGGNYDGFALTMPPEKFKWLIESITGYSNNQTHHS